MKALYPFLLWLFSALGPLAAQNPVLDRAFNFDFENSCQALAALPDGGWAMGIRSNLAPGRIFTDSLWVVVRNSDGTARWRKKLPRSNEEVHYFHQITGLTNGHMLVVTEATLCDVGSYKAFLYCLNAANGGLLWSRASSGYDFPRQWELSSDGHLLGISYNKLFKINADTGTDIYDVELFSSGSNMSVYNFSFLPGADDFIATGTPDLQFWSNQGSPSAPDYVMTHSKSVPDFYQNPLPKPNALGTFFIYNGVQHRVETINSNLNLTVLPQEISGTIWDWEASDAGLFLIESNGGNPNVRKISLDGQSNTVFPISNDALFAQRLAVQDDLIGVAGDEQLLNNGLGIPLSTPQNAWLRVFSSNNLNVEENDVEITTIQQLAALDSTQTTLPFGNPPAVVYSITGGNFQVQIKNNNPEPLQEVVLSIGFDVLQSFICFEGAGMRRAYQGLNLAPGDSMWLDFGTLEAQGLDEFNELCFWVTAPNAKAELNHLNSYACLSPTFTVPTQTPSASAWSIRPNPTADATQVVFTENADLDDIAWQLFDAQGRVLHSGKIVPGTRQLRLEMAQLPSGIYTFRCAGAATRIVVQK